MAHNLNNISATALKMARKEGAKNYRRSLVKELVAEFLPNGNLLWKAVADEYKRRSGEKDDRDPREMEKYWRFNSLTPKSVPAGTKLVLFGRYVLNIYVGIVRYFLRTTKLSVPKSTYRHNAQIGEYRTILTSAKKIRF